MLHLKLLFIDRLRFVFFYKEIKVQLYNCFFLFWFCCRNRIVYASCTIWMIIRIDEGGWINFWDLWTNDVHQYPLVRQYQNNHWIYIGYICWLKSGEDSSRYARCRCCSIVSLRLSEFYANLFFVLLFSLIFTIIFLTIQ